MAAGGWPAERIPVHGPVGTDSRIAAAHGIEPSPGMHEEFDFHHWTPAQPTTIGPFTITPLTVRHPIEEPYALRIEAAGEDGTTRVLTYPVIPTAARDL